MKIDDEICLLVNLYNPNTGPQQLETLHELETILLKFDTNEYNHIIFSGDFKFFFNASLEATRGNAKLKTHTSGRFLELKDKFDLCDIWRIKHSKTKNFTFRLVVLSSEDWITFLFCKIVRKEQEIQTF